MMKTAVMAIVLATGLLCGSVLCAANDFRSFSAKRQAAVQIVNCMKRRMAADHHISYNEAAKACRDEAAKQFDAATSTPLVADAKR